MPGELRINKEQMRAGFAKGRTLVQEEWSHPSEIKWLDELIAEGVCEVTAQWEYLDNYQCKRRRVTGIAASEGVPDATNGILLEEAAAEIERLRTELERLRATIWCCIVAMRSAQASSYRTDWTAMIAGLENTVNEQQERPACTHPRKTGGGSAASDGSSTWWWTCQDCGHSEQGVGSIAQPHR